MNTLSNTKRWKPWIVFSIVLLFLVVFLLLLSIPYRNFFSTYLGGSSKDTISSLTVDPATGDLIVAGETSSADFPLQNAFDTTYGGESETFLARVGASGQLFISSSFPFGINIYGVALFILTLGAVLFVRRYYTGKT